MRTSVNKVFEYLIVSFAACVLLIASVGIIASANRDILRRDCEAMGQHRDGGLHITCAVVREGVKP